MKSMTANSNNISQAVPRLLGVLDSPGCLSSCGIKCMTTPVNIATETLEKWSFSGKNNNKTEMLKTANSDKNSGRLSEAVFKTVFLLGFCFMGDVIF